MGKSLRFACGLPISITKLSHSPLAIDTTAFQPGLLAQPQQALIVFLP